MNELTPHDLTGLRKSRGEGRLLRLSLVIPRQLPSATIYIIKPLMELARQKRLIFSVCLESDVRVAYLRASDIVLFCRNMDPRWDWVLEECLAQNIPTVYALDDNFWEVPLEWKYASHYRTPERLRQLERYLQSVDLVQVYSKPLVERVSRFNANICLMRPCIDTTLAPKVALPRRDDKLRFTYVTGRGSSDSLIQVFAEDLSRLLDEYTKKVEMTWWGEAPDRFCKHPSTRVVNGIDDYDQFLSYLAHEGFDIGLAPLTPTHFNLSKTNTKFRDYGVCRIAGVYSNVEVYSSCVEHEKTGLLVGDAPGAWFEAMQRLVLDASLRENIREAAYRFVDQNYRQEVAEKQWLEIIETLLIGRGESARKGRRIREMKVSLGSERPPAGFMNVAKAPGRGDLAPLSAGVIAEIDQPLPFAANSVDELFVDRWLEDAANPDDLVREIYRVSKHGARVGILAHYSPAQMERDEKAKAVFNEGTPWFWTPFQPPVCGGAALEGESSQARPPVSAIAGVDLRCLHMEFFYYPPYVGLPEGEKRKLRRQEAQVCEYILYDCIAIQQALQEAEAQALIERVSALPGTWHDAPTLVLRRLQELNEVFKDEMAWARSEIQKAQKTEQELKTDLELKTGELNTQMPMARLAAQELDAVRNRRLVRLIERFLERVDYSSQLPEAFQQTKDDSLFFSKSLKGYRLRPSLSLTRLPYLSYRISLGRPNLYRVGLAFLFDLFPRQGEIGLQILSSNGVILAQATTRADEICTDAPVHFKFSPLARSADEALELRVFGKDLDVPVRLYEWVKWPLLGLGRPQTRPFCSFDFFARRSE